MLDKKELSTRCEEINERLHFAKGWLWNFREPVVQQLIGLREYLQKTVSIIDRTITEIKIKNEEI